MDALAINVPPVIAVHKAHSEISPLTCEFVKNPSQVNSLPDTVLTVATRGESGVVSAVVETLGESAPVPTSK